jgi:hypothetical protein
MSVRIVYGIHVFCQYLSAIINFLSGYLVNPSREAIKIARSEGLVAFELPAISSLDTMISELGFEPGLPGLQVLEATDLLMYSRKLMTDSHVVINQIGCVGDVTFHYKGFLNPHFSVLIKYLINFYGEDHVVYHYIGSQFPVCKSLVERFKLADLLMPENAANIPSMSTMYLPPLTEGALDLEMAKSIGMVKVTKGNLLTTDSKEGAEGKTVVAITSSSKKIDLQDDTLGVRGFSEWSVPEYYKPVKPSALAKCLIDVSQSPRKLREFKKEMKSPTLPEYQAHALKTRNSDWIRFAMKNDQVEVEKAMKKAGHAEVPKTSIPCISKGASLDSAGLSQVDGVPNTAKSLMNAPRTVSALIVGPNRASLDSAGLSQVDGVPNTAKPLMNTLRTASALINCISL